MLFLDTLFEALSLGMPFLQFLDSGYCIVHPGSEDGGSKFQYDSSSVKIEAVGFRPVVRAANLVWCGFEDRWMFGLHMNLVLLT